MFAPKLQFSEYGYIAKTCVRPIAAPSDCVMIHCFENLRRKRLTWSPPVARGLPHGDRWRALAARTGPPSFVADFIWLCRMGRHGWGWMPAHRSTVTTLALLLLLIVPQSASLLLYGRLSLSEGLFWMSLRMLLPTKLWSRNVRRWLIVFVPVSYFQLVLFHPHKIRRCGQN